MSANKIPLEPITRASVADQVREQILCWLYSDLKPGAQLPSERELAEAMQVSRSSVREILQGLVMENILSTTQGGGYFVREVGPDSLVQSPVFSGHTAKSGNPYATGANKRLAKLCGNIFGKHTAFWKASLDETPAWQLTFNAQQLAWLSLGRVSFVTPVCEAGALPRMSI
jgi:DNA-binding transcriptional MocR family regulator